MVRRGRRRPLHGGDVGADLLGRHELDRAVAVAEEGGHPLVRHDVAGVRGGVRDVGEARRVLEGVVVVAVRLALDPGVVHPERITVGDDDVAPVTRVAEPEEALARVLADGLPGRRVDEGEAALVGEQHARLDAPHLTLVAPDRRGRRGARRGRGGGGVGRAAGEDDGGREEEDGGAQGTEAWSHGRDPRPE